MAEVLVLKIYFENTLRRFTVADKSSITFPLVENRIRDLFNIPLSSAIEITYEDNEGDLVIMADNEDVADAVVFQKLNPVRLAVKLLPVSEAETKSEAKAETKADRKADAKIGAKNFEKADVENLGEEFKKSFKDIVTLIQREGSLKDLDSLMLTVGGPSLVDFPSKFADAFVTLLKPSHGEPSNVTRSGETRVKVPSDCEVEVNVSQPQDSDLTKPSATNATSTTAERSSAPLRVFHPGVQCDVCGVLPIAGARYKSAVVDNYDLCSDCFSTHGADGDYHKIERPIYRSRLFDPCHGRRLRGHTGPVPRGLYRPHPGHPQFPAGECPYLATRGNGTCARPDQEPVSEESLDAHFVKDVTVFDGTELAPGTAFTKIWLLKNSGSVAWPQHTRLVCVGGDHVSEKDFVLVPLPETGLKPGEELEVSVDMVAPETPGRYASHWRLMAPGGKKFGHRVWSLIVVIPEGDPSPQVEKSLFDAIVEQQEETTEAVAPVDSQAVNVTESVAEDVAPVLSVPQSGLGSPKTENTSVGGFSIVDHPSEVKVEEVAANGVDVPPNPTVEVDPEATVEVIVNDSVNPTVEEFQVSFERISIFESLLDQLEAMGFPDRVINAELLKENDMDLQKVLDKLVEASEWDPMLEELEEMGFNDSSMNRRLMMKSKGSVKQVVKELVQMYKGQQKV